MQVEPKLYEKKLYLLLQCLLDMHLDCDNNLNTGTKAYLEVSSVELVSLCQWYPVYDCPAQSYFAGDHCPVSEKLMCSIMLVVLAMQ